MNGNRNEREREKKRRENRNKSNSTHHTLSIWAREPFSMLRDKMNNTLYGFETIRYKQRTHTLPSSIVLVVSRAHAFAYQMFFINHELASKQYALSPICFCSICHCLCVCVCFECFGLWFIEKAKHRASLPRLSSFLQAGTLTRPKPFIGRSLPPLSSLSLCIIVFEYYLFMFGLASFQDAFCRQHRCTHGKSTSTPSNQPNIHATK